MGAFNLDRVVSFFSELGFGAILLLCIGATAAIVGIVYYALRRRLILGKNAPRNGVGTGSARQTIALEKPHAARGIDAPIDQHLASSEVLASLRRRYPNQVSYEHSSEAEFEREVSASLRRKYANQVSYEHSSEAEFERALVSRIMAVPKASPVAQQALEIQRGKMVEKICGQTIGQALQDRIFGPLKMTSTSFKISAEQHHRLAGMHARAPDGTLAPLDLIIPQEPELEMAGGGLYSTVHDYLRFMRMILGGGSLDGVRVLRSETVVEMVRDQVPDMDCGCVPSVSPEILHDADFFPGTRAGWGLSFVINRAAVPQGRTAGSLAWAGLSNCYYWIDLKRNLCAVLATQLLPFFDPKTIALLREFERRVYAEVGAG